MKGCLTLIIIAFATINVLAPDNKLLFSIRKAIIIRHCQFIRRCCGIERTVRNTVIFIWLLYQKSTSILKKQSSKKSNVFG